jgi:hypothetical protein
MAESYDGKGQEKMTRAEWDEWNRRIWIAWFTRNPRKDKRSFLQYREEMATRTWVA